MPSSISNSNQRLFDAPWLRTWILAAALAIALAAGVESRLRSLGHRPTVNDDRDNWCLQRENASTGDAKSLAVLGISRSQLGFHTQTFREMFPGWRLANLPVEGRPPLATLRDLADDESFKGVALIEITEPGMLRHEWEAQKEYVDYYHETWRFDRRMVRLLANEIQSRLAMVNSTLSIRELVTKAIEGERIRPLYLVTLPDRSRLADFSMADMDKLWQFLMGVILENRGKVIHTPQSAWQLAIAEFAAPVKKIESRGGKVAFVRFPTQAPLKVDQINFPKAEYWDVFARTIGTVTLHHEDVPALHFRDEARTVPFPTPDWSHLDEKDAPIFTKALLNELKQRGVLPK